MTKSRLVLVLHMIGLEGGASFLDQSQSAVKQNQCNPGLLWYSIENCSNMIIYTDVLNCTDELSTTEERRLNQFGSAG